MQLSLSSELVVPLGTNLFAPPWRSRGFFSKFGLGDAIQKARMKASSSSNDDKRNWLPVNDSQQQQLRRQRSQPSTVRNSAALKAEEKLDAYLRLGGQVRCEVPLTAFDSH